jgi:hypothetical protein
MVAGSQRAFSASLSSYHGVLAGCLPEPLGAELGLALKGVEVDVDQAEPVAEAVHPLEVVLGAPQEVVGDAAVATAEDQDLDKVVKDDPVGDARAVAAQGMGVISVRQQVGEVP